MAQVLFWFFTDYFLVSTKLNYSAFLFLGHSYIGHVLVFFMYQGNTLS